MSATTTMTQTATQPAAPAAGVAAEQDGGSQAKVARRGQTVDMRTFFDRIARKHSITKEGELRDLLQELTIAMGHRVGTELLSLLDDIGRRQARLDDIKTTFNIIFVGQPELQAELSTAIDDALSQYHQYNANAGDK